MKNEDIEASRRKGRFAGGAIMIIVGAGLLLQRLNLNIPSWVLSWQMLVICIGLILGFKHNFKLGGWLVPVVVGGIFLAGEISEWPYESARFIWPVVLIMIGISIILKRNYSENEWHFRKKRFAPDEEYINSDDMIDASAIFGSVNKIVMSKNFRGGDVTSIFGGTELNFMKADINNTAVVDVTAIFGGCEIIVPSNWKVKVDITTILGGVEDKRPMELMTSAASDKLLILKGSCIFGGVEIKSYA